MYNKVEICGVNTADLKVLSESDKMRLLQEMHAGQPGAREELVNGNLRLVLSVVQRFTQRGENLDDLFQVGCIGLIKSIDNFDVSLNVRFSTYAVPMIIGEIRRYLRDNNSIRIIGAGAAISGCFISLIALLSGGETLVPLTTGIVLTVLGGLIFLTTKNK